MWTCPKCERQLAHKNMWHYCQKVDMDDLFANRPDHLLLTFDALLVQIMEWDNVSVSATKNCIVFMHRRTFFVVKPMKTQLNLKFYLPQKIHSPILHKVKPLSNKVEYHVRISDLSELTQPLVSMIHQSYQLHG